MSRPEGLNELFMIFPELYDEYMKPSVNKVSNKVKPMIYSTALNHLVDEENHYWELALAGFNKEDLKVKLDKDENVIRVLAEKKVSKEEKAIEEGKTIISYEMESRVSRAFSLDETCDTTNIKVKFENGVLTISMPKIKPKAPEKNEEYINID